MPLYKYGGPKRATDTEVTKLVLEADKEGNPTKALNIGEVGELTEEQRDEYAPTSKLTKVDSAEGHTLGLGFEEAGKDSADDKSGDDAVGEGGEVSIERAQKGSTRP